MIFSKFSFLLVILQALFTPIFSECKAHKPAKETHDRLLGTEDSKGAGDPPFDWLAFWELLKPQLHYLLAAIVVSSSKLIIKETGIRGVEGIDYDPRKDSDMDGADVYDDGKAEGIDSKGVFSANGSVAIAITVLLTFPAAVRSI